MSLFKRLVDSVAVSHFCPF